jgi:S-formylglutathione hydrolase FrmB
LIRVFGDASSRPLRILYVLPVEPREEAHYGDGFEELRKLAVQGWLVVAPSFAQIPWYADHPTDPLRRHESHFVKAVVPFIDAQFPADARRRCLLGFSKSGWGAYSLLLRHPDLFYAASAWDAPLTKDKPDQFKMQEIFGTQANFEGYRITTLLRENAALLRERKRLHLAGYGNFRKHTQDAHALLDELKIPHDYQDGPHREHVWGSGWLGEAVRALELLAK